MRHYEIVFLVHPDQSEQVPAMIERYRGQIEKNSGKIHKAHFVLLNIECNREALEDLKHTFKFNDAILRNLIIKRDEAVTVPSPMLKKEKSEREHTAGASA